MLTCFINKEKNDWDESLDQLAFCYNTSVQSKTNFTPYELMFGCSTKLPISIFYKALSLEDVELNDNCPIVQVHLNRLKKYHGSARPLSFENEDKDTSRVKSGVVGRRASKKFNKSFQGRPVKKRGRPRKIFKAVHLSSIQSHNLTSIPAEISES
ncbi:unnamed protein product, partial [Brachionus calyciflorus]